jgi:ribulose-phosphate 3-epimerase
MNRNILVAPSILAADFCRLGEQVAEVAAAGADRLHVDVMDGHFVPNISIGIPVVRSLRRGATLPLEVHLMIEAPERYIDQFARAGADTIIVHHETCPDLARTVGQIRKLGKKPGVTINPATPVGVLDGVVALVDLVLIMSVNPGFGGQAFIPETLPKIAQMRMTIDRMGRAIDLEVDGGIDATTAPLAVAAGADVLVAGTAIFGAADGIAAAMRRLIQCSRPA